jgi:phage terminase small subunit
VFAAVQDAKAKRAERTKITADMVIREIAKIGFASMRRFMTIEAGGQPRLSLQDTIQDDLDALCEVYTETVMERGGNDENGNPQLNAIRKTKIKLHDKLATLEKLDRHIGVYDTTIASSMNSFAQAIADIQHRTSRTPIPSICAVSVERSLPK